MIFIMLHQNHRKKGGVVAILLFLVVWQLLYFGIDNEILLSSPMGVGIQLINDIREKEFWDTVWMSMQKIIAGFFFAFFLGFFLAVCAFFCTFLQVLFAPFLSVMKAIPVASFVVLLLIWTGSENLSVWISFLVVLPGIYESTLSGFAHADKKMLEMTKVYQVGHYYRWFYVYRLSVLSYLKNIAKTTAGMAWKSGVAAELIGTPRGSLGEQIYLSKIMLDTQGILSWTVVVILLSSIFEQLLLFLLELFSKQKKSIFLPHRKKQKSRIAFESIQGKNINKSFSGVSVFENEAISFENHKVIALMGQSGIGKTTCIRMICGLEKPDEGNIIVKPKKRLTYAVVFQEDRFCEQADAITNVMFLTGKSAEEAKENLRELLPEEKLKCPVQTLSGGMRRRVSIVAAMMSEADVLLMDEPLNGLDFKTKEKTADYICKNRKNRLLILSTHNTEDVKCLRTDKIVQMGR